MHKLQTGLRPKSLSRQIIGGGTGEGLLYDAFMLYDLNGNRTGKNGTRLSADGKQEKMAASYRYDAMNRLTNEDRNGTGERYAYDLCGNRIKKQGYHCALTAERTPESVIDDEESCCYNERNELTERIKAGIHTAYSYDKNGSIISEEEDSTVV